MIIHETTSGVQFAKTVLTKLTTLSRAFCTGLISHYYLFEGLRRRIRITGSGLSATLVTPVTACQLTMGSHSPQWIGTTTRLPSAAPAPRPTEGAGGSTGQMRMTRTTF